eukprot:TRINITY_DN1837_c0_g1_i1.p2 TRINITY_DN1837_c0_g1~~TRINITY_DN1837_c0_g1_i1.p2  ORF type:complete len:179 (+),score=62.96 TRINITY_DN1837_c0_g1_i1:76-612(+)
MEFMGKPELKLALLDPIMMKNKRFQQESDWKIELANRDARRTTYALGFGTFWSMFVFTAPTAMVKRMFGPPDTLPISPWRISKGVAEGVVLGMNGFRPQLVGVARQMSLILPTLAVLCIFQHKAETDRWEAYLKQQTAFGELARTIDAGNLSAGPVKVDCLDAKAKMIFGSGAAELIL